MYKHTYNEMIDAEVSRKLDEPVRLDRNGKICTEEVAHGCKVFTEIVRPDMCIVGDEVGSNLCMKGDGHIGGE